MYRFQGYMLIIGIAVLIAYALIWYFWDAIAGLFAWAGAWTW